MGSSDALASQRRKLWCSQAVLAKMLSKKKKLITREVALKQSEDTSAKVGQIL